MTVKAFKEITEWDTDFTMPNHVYFLSDSKDKMYGYIKSGSGEIKEMNSPYRFKASGRRFKEVNNTWGFFPKEELALEGFVKIAIGSNGEKYTITEVSGVRQCSCPGFKFRGQCRHTEF